MSGVFSALVAMAFSQVAWLAVGGAIVGLLVGVALAFGLIDRAVRALAGRTLPVHVRRVATLSCLVWGLVLPSFFAVSGLAWGLGRGLGNVIEGPVSTTVRATTHTWLARANEIKAGVLGRFALARRLTEGELAAVAQSAPQWLSEALASHDLGAAWQKATGVSLPPQVLAVARAELQTLAARHGAWMNPAFEALRNRAKTAPANRPTLQESVEAMVSPAAFERASAAVRGRAARYVWLFMLSALATSAALAGVLRLLWMRAAPSLAPAVPEARDG